MKVRLHVNKHELSKGEDAYPWTIHTSGQCIRAKEVDLLAPCITEFHPEKDHNPRLFLTCENVVILPLGEGKFVIEKK